MSKEQGIAPALWYSGYYVNNKKHLYLLVLTQENYF